MNTISVKLTQLVQLGLLTDDDLRIDDGIHANEAGSLESLIDRLIDLGRLTKYQAKVIRDGQSERLVVGDYVILEELATGGLGEFYKAYDRNMARDVAIKVVSPAGELTQDQMECFRREAIASARLKHVSFLTAHAVGRHEGHPYLVLEYLPGRDLGSLVRESGDLPVPEAVNYVLQAAIGMAHAHGLGIVHRNLKPSNLLLTKRDESDRQFRKYSRVKILDMSLVRLLPSGGDVSSPAMKGSDFNETGMLIGTVDYMAPEQILDSNRADYRSDIYSLGCTLFYLLTKKPVYSGSSLLERLTAHLKSEIPSLKAARPKVSKELDEVFQKMVAKKPKDRFQSMAEVVKVLTRIDHQFGVLTDYPVVCSIKFPEVDSTPQGSVASVVRSRKTAPTIASGSGPMANVPGSSYGSTSFGEDPPGHSGNDGGSGNDGQNFPEQPGEPHLHRGDFEEAEWAKRDIVDCTVFAPPMISAQEAALIQVFAHIPKAAQAALVAAQEFDEDTKRRGSTTLGTLIEHGSKLSFEFQAKDLLVEAPFQELFWSGRTASVQFAVRAENKANAGTCLGTVLISQNSIPIGRIQFKMTIAASGRPSRSQIPEGETCRYHQAFISYASNDRPEVLRRVQMLKAVGIRFFQDVFELSEGDEWEGVLYQRIVECDVFFLFWSHAAKRSKWVEKEWRYALQNKGDAFIQPIAIEGPPIPAPPQELAHLHFGDVILYFLPRSRFQAVWGFMKRLVRRN